jgi:Sulfotransferase domain
MLKIKESIGLALRSISNIHRPGNKKDIFLFATARGGSTWMMEILASQPGIKFFDEPVNIRRPNVQRTGVFCDWLDLMPDGRRGEDILQFFLDLQKNRYGFLNPAPFRRNYRPVTNRNVFKLHALEHMINELKDRCHGQVVFLLRHPIPTTLSRYEFPRLDRFLLSCYHRSEYLDDHQVNEAWNLYCKGSKLQRGILSWCFENFIPLRHSDQKDWLVLTYEELLLNPEKLCQTIATSLDLPRVDLMLRAVNTPAANIKMSKQDTFAILNERDEQIRRRNLVTKWKLKVTENEERSCFDILSLFGLDTYQFQRAVAHDRYLYYPDTVKLLSA